MKVFCAEERRGGRTEHGGTSIILTFEAIDFSSGTKNTLYLMIMVSCYSEA